MSNFKKKSIVVLFGILLAASSAVGVEALNLALTKSALNKLGGIKTTTAKMETKTDQEKDKDAKEEKNKKDKEKDKDKETEDDDENEGKETDDEDDDEKDKKGEEDDDDDEEEEDNVKGKGNKTGVPDAKKPGVPMAPGVKTPANAPLMKAPQVGQNVAGAQQVGAVAQQPGVINVNLGDDYEEAGLDGADITKRLINLDSVVKILTQPAGSGRNADGTVSIRSFVDKEALYKAININSALGLLSEPFRTNAVNLMNDPTATNEQVHRGFITIFKGCLEADTIQAMKFFGLSLDKKRAFKKNGYAPFQESDLKYLESITEDQLANARVAAGFSQNEVLFKLDKPSIIDCFRIADAKDVSKEEKKKQIAAVLKRFAGENEVNVIVGTDAQFGAFLDKIKILRDEIMRRSKADAAGQGQAATGQGQVSSAKNHQMRFFAEIANEVLPVHNGAFAYYDLFSKDKSIFDAFVATLNSCIGDALNNSDGEVKLLAGSLSIMISKFAKPGFNRRFYEARYGNSASRYIKVLKDKGIFGKLVTFLQSASVTDKFKVSGATKFSVEDVYRMKMQVQELVTLYNANSTELGSRNITSTLVGMIISKAESASKFLNTGTNARDIDTSTPGNRDQIVNKLMSVLSSGSSPLEKICTFIMQQEVSSDQEKAKKMINAALRESEGTLFAYRLFLERYYDVLKLLFSEVSDLKDNDIMNINWLSYAAKMFVIRLRSAAEVYNKQMPLAKLLAIVAYYQAFILRGMMSCFGTDARSTDGQAKELGSSKGKGFMISSAEGGIAPIVGEGLKGLSSLGLDGWSTKAARENTAVMSVYDKDDPQKRPFIFFIAQLLLTGQLKENAGGLYAQMFKDSYAKLTDAKGFIARTAYLPKGTGVTFGPTNLGANDGLLKFGVTGSDDTRILDALGKDTFFNDAVNAEAAIKLVTLDAESILYNSTPADITEATTIGSLNLQEAGRMALNIPKTDGVLLAGVVKDCSNRITRAANVDVVKKETGITSTSTAMYNSVTNNKETKDAATDGGAFMISEYNGKAGDNNEIEKVAKEIDDKLKANIPTSASDAEKIKAFESLGYSNSEARAFVEKSPSRKTSSSSPILGAGREFFSVLS